MSAAATLPTVAGWACIIGLIIVAVLALGTIVVSIIASISEGREPGVTEIQSVRLVINGKHMIATAVGETLIAAHDAELRQCSIMAANANEPITLTVKDDPDAATWVPVRAELGKLPAPIVKRVCCATYNDEPHAPSCICAPPPSPARWSNRR